MTRDYEEWGEDQVVDAVRRNRDAAPDALIRCIVAAADAFVAEAPQHDDMTLIVARVT